MEYFECDVPTDNGLCSDNACPCPEVVIQRGKGYLYIEQSLIDFRREYPAIESARIVMSQRLEQQRANSGGQAINFYRLGPILVCEEGAKLRNLDLKVAAADAKHWWETGLVPLRATPLIKEERTYVGLRHRKSVNNKDKYRESKKIKEKLLNVFCSFKQFFNLRKVCSQCGENLSKGVMACKCLKCGKIYCVTCVAETHTNKELFGQHNYSCLNCSSQMIPHKCK